MLQVFVLLAMVAIAHRSSAVERTIELAQLRQEPVLLSVDIGEDERVTWWLPEDIDSLVLPISGGVDVELRGGNLANWLRAGSPWSLNELPALGARFDKRMLVVIVPWPHYAKLVVIGERVGIRYQFPPERNQASKTDIVVAEAGSGALEVARVYRHWRSGESRIGAIPKPRPLSEKFRQLPLAKRLEGAPHFYLWGSGYFSVHDVPRTKWGALAKRLQSAPRGSTASRLLLTFTDDQKAAVKELAEAEWPMRYLTASVAKAIDHAFTNREFAGVAAEEPMEEVVRKNRHALLPILRNFANSPESWGDGLSVTLLNDLHDAGIDRALLLTSDLYADTIRKDVVERAEELGYLLGPYDSYHSVHSPDANPDDTWETAQFDRKAFEIGRVQNHDGSGHGGFKGRGYHFSPAVAWPYVQQRVQGIRKFSPYTTWFIDCDATAECFDDYHPDHPASRLEDSMQRRRRLSWLETELEMVVGSEGGSAMFSDVIHYGHGVHTPYIGHLHPGFKNRSSLHFLGRHWPPDTPEISFKAIPVPPDLVSPYFDPQSRVPLYQAALGDELIATHHWSFDSLKFSDIESTRQLLEILYMVPPMYHINRESWPKRKAKILKHFAFWSPLHRELATATLSSFSYLTEDRLLQATTFTKPDGSTITLTANFSAKPAAGFSPQSIKVTADKWTGATEFLAR